MNLVKFNRVFSFILIVLFSAVNISALSAQQEYWWNIARNQVTAGNYSEALPFYFQAVAAYPANGLLRAEYAYALQKTGKTKQSIDEYHLALSLPDISRTHIMQVKFNIAMAHAELKEYAKSFNLFTDFLKRYPEFSEAHLNRANLGIILQNYRDAKKDYLRYLELIPEPEQDSDIRAMIALLEKRTHFPAASVDKSDFDEKLRLEEELNKTLNRINTENSQPNSFLGEE